MHTRRQQYLEMTTKRKTLAKNQAVGCIRDKEFFFLTWVSILVHVNISSHGNSKHLNAWLNEGPHNFLKRKKSVQ